MSDKTLLASMTGFARRQGEVGAVSWTWELRSVNGRGLDIKLRLPNGLDALELPLRDLAAKRLKRGNVSAGWWAKAGLCSAWERGRATQVWMASRRWPAERSAGGVRSECTMPRPAVIQFTAPGRMVWTVPRLSR